MRKLTIISHTEHYKNPDGTIVGLGSTVTEINHLLEVFDEVVHVAMLHNILAPPSALPYTSDKITFIALPAVGGPSVNDKLAILYKAPRILKIIKKAIKKTDYFQFRAPTGIGVFVIPYLMFFNSNKGWFKYAGNWKQEKPPMAYGLQRWLLKKQNRFVTINGKWTNQPIQCLTFENPCLTNEEVAFGKELVKNKTLDTKAITFCFVGRLEDEKGLGLLIDAFKNLTDNQKAKIETIHIVGDGKSANVYKTKAIDSDLNFRFHGFMPRNQVHEIYKKSHAIVLPSASEGFPKVIAEAMNFGCLPIVSNISSIGDYIKEGQNGFLINELSTEGLLLEITKVLNLSETVFSKMISIQNRESLKFTYSIIMIE